MPNGPDAGGLRVLITNRTLKGRTGTESYVRDLALSLARRGHSPVVFSPLLGPIASEIRAATIPVVDDLDRIGTAPDIIHGHHGPETLAALLGFPGVPAVTVCHSWSGWADAPPHHPRIRRYVAVDHTCGDRLRSEHGIPDEQIHVALNAVDLERFRGRPPLPARPARALVFSNAAGGRGSHLAAIREACAAAGIAVEVAGVASGRPMSRPEEVLGEFDLVFAKARAALEAMAVGSAVILCDAVGAGPLVDSTNFNRLRPLNFGMRALREPVTPEWIGREIARYDAADAAAVSRVVRQTAGQDALVDDLCALYEAVIQEHRAAPPIDPAEESRAAGRYVQSLGPRLYQRDLLRGAFLRLLRLPVVGGVVRRWGSERPSGHWMGVALGMEEAD